MHSGSQSELNPTLFPGDTIELGFLGSALEIPQHKTNRLDSVVYMKLICYTYLVQRYIRAMNGLEWELKGIIEF